MEILHYQLSASFRETEEVTVINCQAFCYFISTLRFQNALCDKIISFCNQHRSLTILQQPCSQLGSPCIPRICHRVWSQQPSFAL